MIPQYKGSYNIPNYSDSGNAAGAIGDFLINIGNLSSENKEKKKKSDIEAFKQNLQLRQQEDNEQRNSVLNDYQNKLGMQLESTMAEKEATKFDIENVIAGGEPTTESGINLYSKMKTRTPDPRPTMQNGALVQGYTDWAGNRTYDRIQQPDAPKLDLKETQPYEQDGKIVYDRYVNGNKETVPYVSSKSSGATPKPFSVEEYITQAMKANPLLTREDIVNSPNFAKAATSAQMMSYSGGSWTPPVIQKYDTFGNPALRPQEGLKEVRTGRFDAKGNPMIKYEPSKDMEKFNGTYKDMYSSIEKSMPDIADKLEEKNFNSFVDKLEGQKYFNLLQDLTGNNKNLVQDIMTSEVRRASTRAGGFGSMLATTLGNISPFDWSDFDSKQDKIKNDTLSNMLISGRLVIDKSNGINPRTGMYSFYLKDGKGNPIKNEKEMDKLLVEEAKKVEEGSLGNVIGNPNQQDSTVYKNRTQHGVNRMSNK